MKETLIYLSILSNIVTIFMKHSHTLVIHLKPSKLILFTEAVAMCILQIGELSAHLSENFKETYSGVPWRNIKGMRNIMAHKYGDISIATLWETITDDILILFDYCNSVLKQFLVLEKPVVVVKDE